MHIEPIMADSLLVILTPVVLTLGQTCKISTHLSVTKAIRDTRDTRDIKATKAIKAIKEGITTLTRCYKQNGEWPPSESESSVIIIKNSSTIELKCRPTSRIGQ